MNNIEIQRSYIESAIANPESVRWEPITDKRYIWRPVLINTNNFDVNTLSPFSPVSRAIVYSNPQRFSATDIYMVLVEGGAPVVCWFDSNREVPIIFKTDDTDSLIKNKTLLKLIYRGFMRLLDADEVYRRNQEYMLSDEHLQPLDIDDDIPDDVVKKILYSLVHFTNFIRKNNSAKFIDKPVVF